MAVKLRVRPDIHGPDDFRDRQSHNRWLSAWIVVIFLLLFAAVGIAVDHVYLGAFTPGGPSIPRIMIFVLVAASPIAVSFYCHGSQWILRSLGAERLDIRIPEHREPHNIVTEMTLASGCPMPRMFVIFDPAPNALATGRNGASAAICATTGLSALLKRMFLAARLPAPWDVLWEKDVERARMRVG